MANKINQSANQNGHNDPSLQQTVNNHKKLLWLGLLICLLTSIGIANPFIQGSQLINANFIDIMPPSFLILSFISGIGLFIGTVSIERSKVWERSFKNKFRQDMIKNTTLRFRCFFREESSGSIWEITNISHFDWDKAVILIEQKEDKTIVGTEKYNISNVKVKGKIAIHSNFHVTPSSKWRVMVITKEGYHVKFPDFLKRFDLEKAKKYIVDSA